MIDALNVLLDAPCKWCGYNGAGYWQANTHLKGCPWHDVGGEERLDDLPDLLHDAIQSWMREYGK